MHRRSLLTLFSILLAWLTSHGQIPRQQVGFDSPEGWAMKYFSTVTVMHGNGPPIDLKAGQWALGFEIGNIPHLSKEERTVGFDGTKEENLNKAPLLARPLLHYALYDRLSITASYVPPFEIFDGIETHLVGFSVNLKLIDRPRFHWGTRFIGQWSEAKGDFTAWGDIVGNPDPRINEFGAIAPSEDDYVSTTFTIDSSMHWRIKPEGNTWLFLNASYLFGHYEFDVDVPQADNRRHRRNFGTQGQLLILGAGAEMRIDNHLSARLIVVYSPLDVHRPQDYDLENDSMINFRMVINYRL